MGPDYKKLAILYRRKYLNLKNKVAGGADTTYITYDNMYDAANSFAINLFESLDGSSNVFSPVSILTSIALIGLGTDDQASVQLARIIGYKFALDDVSNLMFNLNNCFVRTSNLIISNKQFPINPKYISMVGDAALVTQNNFNNKLLLAQKINHYVEQKTDGMIKEIINQSDIDPNSTCIIINTVYFKSCWAKNFDPDNTTLMGFGGSNKSMVNMMYQQNYFDYYEDKSLQMVELPYEDGYVMGIILPGPVPGETGLDYSLNNVPRLSSPEITEMINNLVNRKIKLYIPKFTHEKSYQIDKYLKKIGITDIFEPGHLDIVGKNFAVSRMVHRAVVVVDEIGTEAAAVTHTGLCMCAPPGKKDRIPVFKADHSFVYYIRHKSTNLILFYGDYQGPEPIIN